MTTRSYRSTRSGAPLTGVVVLALVALAGVAAVGLVTAGPQLDPGTTLEASDSGPTITITEELDLDDSPIFPDDHTVDLSPHAVFTSDGATNATVESITGTWTNVTTHEVGPGLEIDPGDKQAVAVEGNDVEMLNVSDVGAADDDADLVYDASAPVTVTVTGLPADTTIDVVDVASGGQVAQATTDGAGELSVTLDAGERAVTFLRARANVQVEVTGTNSPVVEGETLTVTVGVENVGTVSTTQSIELRAGKLLLGEMDVALAAGDDDGITLAWETGPGAAGERILTVASENDTDTVTVTVEQGSSPGPDPTPTPGETPTPTPGDTPTPTPGETPTPTPGDTPTPGETPTPTPGGTPTPTPTPGETPTPTPGDTPTPTPGETPTPTPTPGETPAPTPGDTPPSEGTPTPTSTSDQSDDGTTESPDDTGDDGFGPGFGLLSAVAGLVGVLALLVGRFGQSD